MPLRLPNTSGDVRIGVSGRETGHQPESCWQRALVILDDFPLPAVSKCPFSLEENSFLLKKNSFLLKETFFLLEETSFLLGETSFFLEENFLLQEETVFLLEETSFLQEETVFLLKETYFLIRKSPCKIADRSQWKPKQALMSMALTYCWNGSES